MKNESKYDQQLKELEQILNELENSEEFDMQMISKKIKQASKLIESCRAQLKDIDEELSAMIERIE